MVSGSVALLLHNISTSLNESDATSADARSHGVGATADGPLFYGECFESQLHKPKLPYPAWDYNWDGRNGIVTDSDVTSGNVSTRHILLVRHGQYVQGSPDDKDQILTPLGRSQASHTGRRLAALMNQGTSSKFGSSLATHASPCQIKSVYVSCMVRARETADIIVKELNDNFSNSTMFQAEPDALLNEGLPAAIIPFRHDVGDLVDQAAEINEHHDRIEKAYQKYFYRDDPYSSNRKKSEHEFEVIVCHANVIRYFLMRALQLPPEAWLRLSLFNCSITYIMIQPSGYVTARLIGDTGHIPYEETTFSGSYGYNWAGGPSTASR